MIKPAGSIDTRKRYCNHDCALDYREQEASKPLLHGAPIKTARHRQVAPSHLSSTQSVHPIHFPQLKHTKTTSATMPTIYLLWQLLQIIVLLYQISLIYGIITGLRGVFEEKDQATLPAITLTALTLCVVAGGMWEVAGLRALRV